ncbi:zinc ribbon domain-containing protein [Streptomyces sp. NPDC002935]|uniref:RNA-guided endonuclease InsQ/TnpB family protein n=1 Tax=Streptomyces sp. NPDC002935 TaxID=3154545 RepID=UPI0033B2218A
MQLRYTFRIEPGPGQRMALGRAFGCARVVYNDAPRARETARRHGLPFPKTGDLSKLLITDAKHKPERAWLSEVSAVVLQQSLRDLDTAYKNFFDSLKGTRPRMGAPRFKSRRDNRQAVRFTANARWSLAPGGKLRLPKIGDVKVKWSRTLPSTPSTVTVVKDAAGRYFASFVAETYGSEVLLRKAQQDLSRKAKGSSNRKKKGLARTSLAKSVHDAGWSTFVTMLEYKAARHGRTFNRVDRFFPSSQLCSACGFKDGPKPLAVRERTCTGCGTIHDRDVNAARNIRTEKSKVAAGRAETQNACGG